MKLSAFLIVSIFSVVSFVVPSFANKSGLPFEVEPILPSNQDSDVENYISLTTDKHSLKQVFEFKVRNKSNKAQSVDVGVVDAYTSPSGVVQYINEEQENSFIVDEGQKMSNYLQMSGENVISLNAKEEKVLRVELDAEDVEGTLLGGVSFKLHEEGETEEKEGASFKINNQINMVVGVKVDFETDQDVQLMIDKPFVDPMPSYYTVRLPITLDAPFLKKLDFKYQVLKKDEVLFHGEDEYDFAPKTKTNVSLAWEHDEIEKDVPYLLKGEITYKDVSGEEKVVYVEEEFMYESEGVVSEVFNALTVPIEKIGVPLWLLIGAFVGILALVYVYLKKRAVYVVYIKDEHVPDVVREGDPIYPRLRRYNKKERKGSVLTEGVSECFYKKTSKGIYVRVKVEK